MEMFLVLCAALTITLKWFEYAEKRAKEEDQNAAFDTSKLPKPIKPASVETVVSTKSVKQQPRQPVAYSDGVFPGEQLPTLKGFKIEANEAYRFNDIKDPFWDGFIEERIDQIIPEENDWSVYEDTFHSHTLQ